MFVQALGSGAFAEVRLCFHKRTGAKYAAKIVDKNKFALNKELRKGSFRDEVEILKSIDSPYIVHCYDIFGNFCMFRKENVLHV